MPAYQVSSTHHLLFDNSTVQNTKVSIYLANSDEFTLLNDNGRGGARTPYSEEIEAADADAVLGLHRAARGAA